MTRQEFSDRLLSWPTAIGALVGIVVALIALSGFARTSALEAERSARIAGDTSIIRMLDARDEQLQKKLDCALFTLPKNCRETIAPRMP